MPCKVRVAVVIICGKHIGKGSFGSVRRERCQITTHDTTCEFRQHVEHIGNGTVVCCARQGWPNQADGNLVSACNVAIVKRNQVEIR
jgi:hypothetical protein